MTNVRKITPATSRVEALWRDPNLTGELLLVALAWDRLLEQKARKIGSGEIEQLTGIRPLQYGWLIRNDIPHYNPPSAPRRCMHVGPKGGKCTRSPIVWGVPDVEDGTVFHVVGCQVHFAWAKWRITEIEAAREGRVPPKPAYNTRSKVAHHFPEIDFPFWWSKWTGYRQEPYDVTRDPERGGSHLPQRPNLRVVMSA